MAIQSQSVTFTASDPYQDITWDEQYASFRLFCGVTTTDGSVVAVTLVNITDSSLPPESIGVRVEPSAPFDGEVSVVCMEILP